MPDGRKWKLVQPFTYRIGNLKSKEKIAVPRGFVTDFASIPWLFWTFLPAWGRYGKGAVLHDWLYRTTQYIATRKRADEIFYEAMLVGGTKRWKAWVMYRAVRLFGFMAWH